MGGEPVSQDLLISREVAGLFPPSAEVDWERFVSVDTAREFRVMSERGHEFGVFVDDHGVLHHADWFSGTGPSVNWWSNSRHAVEVSLALSARGVTLGMAPITWRNPLAPGELPPGYELSEDGGTMTVAWDNGRSWVKQFGTSFPGSRISALVTWLPHSIREILDSIANPPGAVGLVPYRRAERISVDEALAAS